MCTVSVIPLEDGFRVAVNRDERRSRPPARRPAAYRIGIRTAVYPTDPQGGGTWIGANDLGVVAALLNRTAEGGAGRLPPDVTSRGRIIPTLLGSTSIIDALDVLEATDPRQYALFRLVLLQRMAAIVVTSDGRRLSLEPLDISKPAMVTSSSLGDELVEGPRRTLFESMVVRRAPALWLTAQSRFHAHSWPTRRHLSVMMQRRDARTVSRTFVRVTASHVELRYRPTGRGAPAIIRATPS